jgi:hypothetical protein
MTPLALYSTIALLQVSPLTRFVVESKKPGFLGQERWANTALDH